MVTQTKVLTRSVHPDKLRPQLRELVADCRVNPENDTVNIETIIHLCQESLKFDYWRDYDARP